jgi:hypothetical protein
MVIFCVVLLAIVVRGLKGIFKSLSNDQIDKDSIQWVIANTITYFIIVWAFAIFGCSVRPTLEYYILVAISVVFSFII